MAGPDGTFGSRFDDPEATYRVRYASSLRLGCYLETLARFRPDLSLLAELAEIEGEDDFPPLGQVPPEWAETRVVGSAFHYGSYADVYSSEWIGILREQLAGFCIALGIPELDAGALQQPCSRPLTQRVSRVVFNNAFDGIPLPLQVRPRCSQLGAFRAIQDRSSTSDTDRSGRFGPAGCARDPWPATRVTMIGRFTAVVS